MRGQIKGLLAISVCLMALWPRAGRCGGFILYEQGSAASGQAAAFVARAYDGSAVFYNPGGLGWQDGLTFYLGSTLIVPGFSHETPDGLVTDVETNLFPTPNLYISYQFLDEFVVALGTFANFGLGVEWPEGWHGQEEIISSNLTTYTINPTFAWRPHRTFSFGVGFDIMIASLDMKQGFYPGQDAGTAHLGGSTVGFGGNAGLLWKPLDWLSLGFSYRSAIYIDAEGKVDFDMAPALASTFPDQKMSTSILLPHVFVPAVAFTPLEWLDLEVDVQFVTWNTFDELAFDFAEAPSTRPEGGGLYDKVLREEWTFSTMLRVGVEARPGLGFAVRAGYIYDPNQVPPSTLSPRLPDSNRHDVSLGIGWRGDWLSVDAFYMAVIITENTVTSEVNSFPGTYSGLIHLTGLHLGFHFL